MKKVWLGLCALSLFVGCSGSSPPGEKGATAGGGATAAVGNTTVGFEIGNMAPDIEGQDFDDVTFKLSDYRGKVVVLDFWGDW